MENKVFDRIEKKYLLTKEQKRQIQPIVKSHMRKDSYYKSTVMNLYFDTDNYNSITDSIDWTIYKYKLRARSYGGYDRVFLEIKSKLRGIENNPGYKRRVMITKKEFTKLINNKTTLSELIANSTDSKNDQQIATEIDYLLEHNGLKPKILVIYNRESYQGDNNLRITFDENLKYRDQNLRFTKGKHDKIYFKEDKNIIMEIKAHDSLPLWLVHELSKHKLYPQRFSKIGKVYEKIIKEQNV